MCLACEEEAFYRAYLGLEQMAKKTTGEARCGGERGESVRQVVVTSAERTCAAT